MDDTVLKIALAGLLHDIGKFAEEGMDASPDFINSNAELYQPFFNNHYTHKHAVFTAAFIDHIEKLLPSKLNKSGWGLGIEDPFINLAAKHHKPETAGQWIVAIADRVSSGWDRANFDSEYNSAIAWQNYRKTRLLPIFERMLKNGKKDRRDYQYCYPLKELTPQNIYPVLREEEGTVTEEQAAKEYKDLFDQFIFSLEKLHHRSENIELWFEHLDSLLLIFASMIPAARAGKVLPDVSLYDHSRAVSALSAAMYLFHRDTKSITVEAVQNYYEAKFLLVSGDFYGIQDFIFSDHGESGKNRAKLLRGRSFAVSLYSELAADLLCREIGLPPTAVLLNAAGKFTIIAPNLKSVRDKVKKAEEEINRWLMDISFGESCMGFSSIEAAPVNFVSGKFIDHWDRLAEKMAVKKMGKFDLDRYAGVVEGYLDKFRNDLDPPLCPFCGKRPSHPEASRLKIEEKAMCRICRDHIFLGEHLVKCSQIAILTGGAEINDPQNKLLAPVFDHYQVAFLEGKLSNAARNGQLLKCWDISISESGRMSKEVTARFLNGYVPVYRSDDLVDGRYLEGKKSEEKKLAMVDEIRTEKEKQAPKTFSHIAAKALNKKPDGNGEKYCGIQALGIFKADVDQLGMLMACGLSDQDFTISRLATLSRQLNFFFAVYLPHLLKTDSRFMDVYTVFAGGDDLFLIGPWNRIMDLAWELRKRFEEYVCRNEHIHFSAGICLQKANAPLNKLAEGAEHALEKAKEGKKNKITVFGETVTWSEYEELLKIRDTINTWRETGLINNAMVFKLNDFISLVNLEKKILAESGMPVEDMRPLKWRALFRYSTERNIGKYMKNEMEKKAAKEQFGKAADWLERFGGSLKIALWNNIYNSR